jgi:hypothetical protein
MTSSRSELFKKCKNRDSPICSMAGMDCELTQIPSHSVKDVEIFRMEMEWNSETLSVRLPNKRKKKAFDLLREDPPTKVDDKSCSSESDWSITYRLASLYLVKLNQMKTLSIK